LVIPEVHILNIAVHPQNRQRGIGSSLLQHGLAYGWQKGGRYFTLEVRRSNYPAIGLYKKFQFQPWGIRRRYYTDTGEDALVMGLHLEEAPSLVWL
ncbi:MAG: ribosomal protein S18-alanine N-acetyltransferase, partial [bacterium]